MQHTSSYATEEGVLSPSRGISTPRNICLRLVSLKLLDRERQTYNLGLLQCFSEFSDKCSLGDSFIPRATLNVYPSTSSASSSASAVRSAASRS